MKWIIRWLGLLLVLQLVGCCWFSKRSCYPDCPPPDRVVVEIEKPCELPPIALAPTKTGPLLIEDGEGYRPAKTQAEEKEAKGVFFSIGEAGKLAKNLSELMLWVSNARKRCAIPSPPASLPASRPVPPDT
jgi:hypothetical protein